MKGTRTTIVDVKLTSEEARLLHEILVDAKVAAIVNKDYGDDWMRTVMDFVAILKGES